MDYNNYTTSPNEEVIGNNEKAPSPVPKMALTEGDNTKVKFTSANSFPVEPSRNGEAKVEIENIQMAFAGMGKEELMKFANDPFWIRLRWFLLILFWFLWLAMLVGAIIIIIFAKRCDPLPTIDWWQSNVIYRIAPASFQDTDGDGVGDIKGIESRMDYLTDLGVKTLLLGAIYASSGNGLNSAITNHSEINPTFGTLTDFDSLISNLKNNDIKIVMDFIPEYTSNASTWFIESRGRNSNYTDYYVWEDGTGPEKKDPPEELQNNLESAHWAYDDKRNQYYLYHDSEEQPVLDLTNPLVRQELNDILLFWLERGSSGFLVEDLSHHKDPNIYVMLAEWRQFLSDYEKEKGEGHKLLIIRGDENQDLNTTMLYYGKETEKLADFPLNFQFPGTQNGNLTGATVTESITSWFEAAPKFAWPNWMLGNREYVRTFRQMELDLIDGFHMIMLLLTGTPITYYGDELGMMGATLESTPSESAFVISPMQWNGSDHAGFSSNASVNAVLGLDYKEINVEKQNQEDSSHLKVYKKLVKLRTERVMKFGSLAILNISSSVVCFARFEKGYPGYVVVINIENTTAAINLNNIPTIMPQYGTPSNRISFKFPETGNVEIASSNIPSSSILNNRKNKLKLSQLALGPREAVVIKFVPVLA